MSAAYHKSMEEIMLLLLVSMLDQNPQAKQTLGNFLKFYRDNRALFTALGSSPSASASSPPENPKSTAAEQEEDKQKDRPMDGPVSILEEYLSRA